MILMPSTVTDSSTVKALLSTILTFVVIFSLGAVGNAIGQNTAEEPSALAVSPYAEAEVPPQVASHNKAQPTTKDRQVGHNR